MNKEQFAEKIIKLRKKKGYTQAQLAELLNVSNKAVSRWETAEGYPDITLLKPLSEALGISCDELLGDTESYSLWVVNLFSTGRISLMYKVMTVQ